MLGASAPPTTVGLFVCLILGLQPLQLLARCWWIRIARAKGLIHFEDGQGGVGNFSADMNDGRDKGLAVEQPLEAGDTKGRFMPDQRDRQQVYGLAEVRTTNLRDCRGGMHRGARTLLTRGKPGGGPPFAPRGEALPVFERGEQVGG